MCAYGKLRTMQGGTFLKAKSALRTEVGKPRKGRTVLVRTKKMVTLGRK